MLMESEGFMTWDFLKRFLGDLFPLWTTGFVNDLVHIPGKSELAHTSSMSNGNIHDFCNFETMVLES